MLGNEVDFLCREGNEIFLVLKSLKFYSGRVYFFLVFFGKQVVEGNYVFDLE